MLPRFFRRSIATRSLPIRASSKNYAPSMAAAVAAAVAVSAPQHLPSVAAPSSAPSSNLALPAAPKKKKKGIMRKSKALKERLQLQNSQQNHHHNHHQRPSPLLPPPPHPQQKPKARQKPSPQSGGIPEPSEAYLEQATGPATPSDHALPALLPLPRQILVILDLNGTLLYRPDRRHSGNFIARPHAEPFLSYCLDTFVLAIWSSAKPENVRKMVAKLLTPAQAARCVVIWARDKLGLCADDYSARVQVYKRLSVVWADERVQQAHPAHDAGARWDQTNTVLVDDSAEKGRSEPYNILPLPEFSGPSGEVPNVLPQVHDYLNALCYQPDISRYMRRNPFTLDPDYALPADA